MILSFRRMRNVILVMLYWITTIANAQLGTKNFIRVNCSDSSVQAAAAIAFGPLNNPQLQGKKNYSFKLFSAYEKVCLTSNVWTPMTSEKLVV